MSRQIGSPQPYTSESASDQARKKEHKPKLLSPDIFRWGGGLPREGVGAKKFRYAPRNQGNRTFWQDIPGFCRDIPGAPEKVEEKRAGWCTLRLRGCRVEGRGAKYFFWSEMSSKEFLSLNLTLTLLVVSEFILRWCKFSCHAKVAVPKLTLTLPNLLRINSVQTYTYTCNLCELKL